MKLPSIPQRTQMELASPATPGKRHEQARRIIFSLIGQGFCSEAVFAQVRDLYNPDFKDAEIWSLIRGAKGKNPQPSGHGRQYYNSPAPVVPPVTEETATAAAKRFVRGFPCNEANLWHASPWRPLEDPGLDALLLFAGLFLRGELINVCVELGVGVTQTRDQWMLHIRERGSPSGSIGCMFRPNPVTGKPTGEKGGWTDKDIIAHRFSLLESDLLPLDLQLAVIARLPLPIAAVIFSGEKSYHALVHVDAPDATAYRKHVSRMLALLRPLGFDTSTGNPSRMARLPGAMRGKEKQRLLYLNPEARSETPIFGDTDESKS